MSKRVKKWCEDANVQLHITTPAHFEAKRCCEGSICTFRQSLTIIGANSHNKHECIMPTVNGHNSCPHTVTGNTPAVGHFTPQSPQNLTWTKIGAHVQKVRGRMIECDHKDQNSLGEKVFVVSRIRNIRKNLADCHFPNKN
jgi:hypothetical protein